MTLDPEWSDHVGVTEHRVFGAVRELLRPVDDDRFEEATTTQLEEGHQIPEHTQTADTDTGQDPPLKVLNKVQRGLTCTDSV